MSEIVVAVLSMPDELFWSDAPLTRMQHNNIRKEAARELSALKEENERQNQACRYTSDLLDQALAENKALQARVAELEQRLENIFFEDLEEPANEGGEV